MVHYFCLFKILKISILPLLSRHMCKYKTHSLNDTLSSLRACHVCVATAYTQRGPLWWLTQV